VSEKEIEHEEGEAVELHAPTPKLPAAWVSEMVLQRESVRRIEVRYLRMKKAAEHIVGEVRVELNHDTGKFKLEHVSEDGDFVGEPSEFTAKQIVSHMWTWVCSEGIAYAAEHDLSKLRGAISFYNHAGDELNDSSTSRKILNLENPNRPFTEDDDDDDDPDAGIRSELKWERREHRAQQKRYIALVDKIEGSVHARISADAMRSRAAMDHDKRVLEFTEIQRGWMERQVRDQLGEARLDQLLAFGLQTIGPKSDALIDAAIVYMRTGGGRQKDATRVPDMPDEILLCVMSLHGAAQFAAASSTHMKARGHDPTSPGYAAEWRELMAGLVACFGPDGKTPPPAVCTSLAAWSQLACKALQIDPHEYSHITFGQPVEPAAELPEE
jgi:hypothetical protein